MTGEDRTTPRPDLYTPLDAEAFCAAMGIPVETYLEVAAAIAEKFPGTADAGYIAVDELERLRAIEGAARALIEARKSTGMWRHPRLFRALRAALEGSTP